MCPHYWEIIYPFFAGIPILTVGGVLLIKERKKYIQYTLLILIGILLIAGSTTDVLDEIEKYQSGSYESRKDFELDLSEPADAVNGDKLRD
mgnify:CR=1 FL=1